MRSLTLPSGIVAAGILVFGTTAGLAAPRVQHVGGPHRPAHVHGHVHVHRTVVVRPVRPWIVRPYYGAVVAGVTLGTIVVASAVPPAPSPTLCWYWADPSQSKGYWDYCKPPQ